MAVAVFLAGFLLGLLAFALAEGAALLWALRALRRGGPKPPPPEVAAAGDLSGDRPLSTEKQVRILLFFPASQFATGSITIMGKLHKSSFLYRVPAHLGNQNCGISQIVGIEFLLMIASVICSSLVVFREVISSSVIVSSLCWI